MATTEINQEKSRFDTRLPKDQKMFFERAARLGGYRSLTDFIVLTVQKRAKEIIICSYIIFVKAPGAKRKSALEEGEKEVRILEEE
ncbi:MAG: DUF1778 domain-containing protein [Bacteroidetes bacterium]|nr:DUF1778 domain-containing protein [Bacteroidota bacterium]